MSLDNVDSLESLEAWRTGSCERSIASRTATCVR